MRVVVASSAKGGVGKTTICRHLAVEAERAGHGPVALIDTDPMGGLSAWWNERQAETPIFVPTTLSSLQRTLAQLASEGVQLVLIDTPPASGNVIHAVVRLADLVIVPVRPSPDDLRAVGATVDIVEAEGRPMVFVINAATKKARLTTQAAITLSQHGAVAEPVIHRAEAYPTSSLGGLTVCELDPRSPAASEIAGLWQFIHKRLEKRDRQPVSKQARKIVSAKAEAV
jgi:chromosome partitioning protein